VSVESPTAGPTSPARRGPGDRPAVASAGTVIVVAVGAFALAAATAVMLEVLLLDAATSPTWRVVLGVVGGALVAAALWTLVPLARAISYQRSGGRAWDGGDVVLARTHRHRASRSAWIAAGSCLPILLAAGFGLFLLANDHAVQSTFFDVGFMRQGVGDVAKAFQQNIIIAVTAEALVLVWGLVLAIARLAPGVAGRPLRWLATVYVDVFRAIPAIIVIYLVGFGLPLAEVPGLSSVTPRWAAVLALTLTYGAYVAEVYRAGIESIHPSQVAAARSLGLSHGRTLRFVVVPQAVRRVTPPLLNDFIGLQKDTALVTVIGTVDAFTQAKIYASNYFNLSSVTVVALLFVLVTIPQTRFVDRLLARDARRQRSGM